MSSIFTPDTFFYVFSALAIGSALGVVTQKNPVGSLLFMVTALASIAGIFVLFEAHFLAAIQVMVYAGAIMVLFLFVIMLLNLGHDYQQDVRNWVGQLLAFAVVGGAVAIVVRTVRGQPSTGVFDGPGAAAASLDALMLEKGAVGAIADPIFTDYVVAFELTGILLLVAIVGAIALAKRRG
jgi:NADH-quinone oxidoreductase subunit J